jgi:short-subunit dehydrogenase involved in D-alanine esterification of teichoic acids
VHAGARQEERLLAEQPEPNVLVINAGIMRRVEVIELAPPAVRTELAKHRASAQ